MTKKSCSVSGCQARAWHQDLCNLHALERNRARGGQPRRRATEEKLAEGKRLLRQRARELGIVLDEGDRQALRAPAATAKREHVAIAARVKGRSPVA